MGSLLLFSVLSIVMTVTRRVDWYAVSESMAARAVLKGEAKEGDEAFAV